MHKLKHHFSKILAADLQKRVLTLGILALLLVLAFKLDVISLGGRFSGGKNSGGEIEAIKATSVLDDQVRFYKDLIERVGPEQAQDDLFRSGLPFTGQTHLLNHTAGDYLYEKYGPKGLVYCRDYFLSSCYHGFLLHAIADGGMNRVAKSFEYCKKEGPATYTQCAHAIGHGFLTNLGYKNLTLALKTCDEAVSTMPGFPSFNCYDGVFMENIWAVHEGAPSPDRWVNPADTEYPCNDKRIDDKYVLACWSNQPSLMFQFFSAQGGPASGGQDPIKKVGSSCLKVKRTEYQQMCFDGLSRQIHPITQGSPGKTIELCSLMPNQKWINFCISVNAGAGYAVGSRDVPFQICAVAPESAKADCYGRVFSAMKAYQNGKEDLRPLCAQVSEGEWRSRCESSL